MGGSIETVRHLDVVDGWKVNQVVAQRQLRHFSFRGAKGEV